MCVPGGRWWQPTTGSWPCTLPPAGWLARAHGQLWVHMLNYEYGYLYLLMLKCKSVNREKHCHNWCSSKQCMFLSLCLGCGLSSAVKVLIDWLIVVNASLRWKTLVYIAAHYTIPLCMCRCDSSVTEWYVCMLHCVCCMLQYVHSAGIIHRVSVSMSVCWRCHSLHSTHLHQHCYTQHFIPPLISWQIICADYSQKAEKCVEE